MRHTILALGLVVLAMGVATGAPRTAPGVFVTMAPAQTIDDTERTSHIDFIRRSLVKHPAVIDRHIDLTVVSLSITHVGNQVEIVAVINFVLSTTGDQIISFGSQTAKLIVPKRQFLITKLPTLRHEVINDAVIELRRKLRAYAARTA